MILLIYIYIYIYRKLSIFFHLLSNNEIIEEINKLKAYFNTKKINGYTNKKEERIFKKVIHTLNKKIKW